MLTWAKNFQAKLTGCPSRESISCGHMEGVRAEKGPPGVGVKSIPAEVNSWVADTLTPSPTVSSSSSSSDRVSTARGKGRCDSSFQETIIISLATSLH